MCFTTIATPRPERMSDLQGHGYPKPQDAFQQFGAGVGGPIRRNRLWFFVDYDSNWKTGRFPSSIRPSPRRKTTYLTISAFPPGRRSLLRTRLTGAGQRRARPAESDLSVRRVSNALNALNSNLGSQPDGKTVGYLRPASTFRPEPATVCFSPSTWTDSIHLEASSQSETSQAVLWKTNPGQRLCSRLPDDSGVERMRARQNW